MPNSIPLNLAYIYTPSFLTHALHIANTLSSLLYHSCEPPRKGHTSRLNALLKVRGREAKKTWHSMQESDYQYFVFLQVACAEEGVETHAYWVLNAKHGTAVCWILVMPVWI